MVWKIFKKVKFDFNEKVNNYTFKTLHDYPHENKFIPINFVILPFDSEIEKIKYIQKKLFQMKKGNYGINNLQNLNYQKHVLKQNFITLIINVIIA